MRKGSGGRRGMDRTASKYWLFKAFVGSQTVSMFIKCYILVSRAKNISGTN